MKNNLLSIFLMVVFIKLTIPNLGPPPNQQGPSSNQDPSESTKIDVFVNPATIVSIMKPPGNSFTILSILDGKNLVVMETQKQILNKIRKANKRKK